MNWLRPVVPHYHNCLLWAVDLLRILFATIFPLMWLFETQLAIKSHFGQIELFGSLAKMQLNPRFDIMGYIHTEFSLEVF